jgi:hypothetical protein
MIDVNGNEDDTGKEKKTYAAEIHPPPSHTDTRRSFNMPDKHVVWVNGRHRIYYVFTLHTKNTKLTEEELILLNSWLASETRFDDGITWTEVERIQESMNPLKHKGRVAIKVPF